MWIHALLKNKVTFLKCKCILNYKLNKLHIHTKSKVWKVSLMSDKFKFWFVQLLNLIYNSGCIRLSKGWHVFLRVCAHVYVLTILFDICVCT